MTVYRVREKTTGKYVGVEGRPVRGPGRSYVRIADAFSLKHQAARNAFIYERLTWERASDAFEVVEFEEVERRVIVPGHIYDA